MRLRVADWTEPTWTWFPCCLESDDSTLTQVRHCERSEAIQPDSALWIAASLRSSQ